MSGRVDLVVAGGGPAGLAAAIHGARAGLAVTVLDPRLGVIDKACGEGLMPGGVLGLEELGIRPHGAPFVGVRWVDAIDDTLAATGTFPSGVGLGVRRTVLHAAMRQRAEQLGVRFVDQRVESFEQRADVVVVGDIHARWLVGADGLRSVIRQRLGVELPARRPSRLGLRRHHAIAPWSDRVEVHFADHAEAYVTPVDANLVGVAFLFAPQRGDPEGSERFEGLLDRFPRLRERLRDAPAASSVRGAGPFERRVAKRVVGNVLLVGDAAGYLDPLTGEGVSLGLATAKAAVASILEGRPDAYEARYRALSRTYFTMTSGILAIARRPRLRRPLLELARALPSVFDGALGVLSHVDRGPIETLFRRHERSAAALDDARSRR